MRGKSGEGEVRTRKQNGKREKLKQLPCNSKALFIFVKFHSLLPLSWKPEIPDSSSIFFYPSSLHFHPVLLESLLCW